MNNLPSSNLLRFFLRINSLLMLIAFFLLSSLIGFVYADNNGSQKKSTFIPLKIVEYEPLEFGKVVTGGNINKGKVTINAIDGTKTVTFGVVDVDSYHGHAKLLITGEPNARFIIHLRNRGVLIADSKTRKSSNKKNKLKNLKSYPNKFGKLGADGRAWVMVGGDIILSANSSSGSYRGRYTIDVDYLDIKDKQ